MEGIAKTPGRVKGERGGRRPQKHKNRGEYFFGGERGWETIYFIRRKHTIKGKLVSKRGGTGSRDIRGIFRGHPGRI